MWRIIIWSIVLSQSCYAGFERTELGVRPFSLGSAYTGLADDIWAISYNTAGLSQLMSYQVSFYYSPQPFGLTELSTASAAAAIPLSFGVVGLSVRKFGFELYREYSGTLSYARSIAGVHLGVNLNYHSVHIDNYGSDAALGIDLGVLVKSFDRISWGVFLKNINSPTIGSTQEKLPQTFTIGVAYSPLQKCSIIFDVQKETSFEPSPRFGFEYWVIEAAALRGGWMNLPAEFTAGIGFQFLNFHIDYGFAAQNELGWTHCFSLTIDWGEK